MKNGGALWLLLLALVLGCLTTNQFALGIVLGLVGATVLMVAATQRPSIGVAVFLVLVTAGDSLGMSESLRRIPTLGGLVLLLFLALWRRLLLGGDWGTGVRGNGHKGLFIAAALFIGWSVLSAAFSQHPLSAFVYTAGMSVILFCSLWVIPGLLESKKDVKIVFWTLATSTLVYATIALAYKNPSWPQYAVGVFPHPNYLGGVLFFGVAACLLLWADASTKLRFVLGAFLVVTGLALALSISRSAIGASALLVVVYFASSRNWRWLVGITLVAAVAFVAFGAQMSDLQAVQLLQGKMGRGLQGRDVLWEYYWNLALSHPVWGIGGGGTANVIESNNFPVELSPHNTYLRTVLEFGFPGVALYAIFLISSVFFLVKSRPRGRFALGLRAAALGVLFGSLFLQVFEATVLGSFKFSAVYPLIFVAVGLGSERVGEVEGVEVAADCEGLRPAS